VSSSSTSRSTSARSAPPHSTAGSPMPSVERIALVANEQSGTIGDAVKRVEEAAGAAGVNVVSEGEADLVVVLGGDGTMLRALKQSLDTGVPVFGINFGRVGFLTAVDADELESGLARALAGDFVVVELPTLEADVGGATHTAVNDCVATSSTLGRMVTVGWSVGGEDLGTLSCDGVIAATPSGSTAYNLSNGGPVLVWGLDAMVVTFIAPHSLHARPLVVPRSSDLVVQNKTPDVGLTVLADGHPVGELGAEEQIRVRLGAKRTRLATLPEATFFTRYRDTFAS
jgi:NAD+ kinase